ncbi:MAG: agmatinase [bacterium]|nr:agmatinase [bacterium]
MRIFPFIKAYNSIEQSKYLVVSIPYEGYVNTRLGTFIAPKAIRKYSECIESYSNYFNKSLEDISFFDLGDMKIDFIYDNDNTILEIYKYLKSVVINKDKKYVFIGGDHSITIPCFWAIKNIYKNVIYIHLDAHADCHNVYHNQKYSHASVLRRISEENVSISVGVRTLDDAERGYFFSNIINIDLNNIGSLKDYLKGYIYLSVDVDFFDPSIAPAVSNPNSSGAKFEDYIKILEVLSSENIVGFDIVEVNPVLDYPSFTTCILACELLREFLLSGR